jgi:hypothetical protein
MSRKHFEKEIKGISNPDPESIKNLFYAVNNAIFYHQNQLQIVDRSPVAHSFLHNDLNKILVQLGRLRDRLKDLMEQQP